MQALIAACSSLSTRPEARTLPISASLYSIAVGAARGQLGRRSGGAVHAVAHDSDDGGGDGRPRSRGPS